MKIAIIGSTQYKGVMETYADGLRYAGNPTKIPIFDDITAKTLDAEYEINSANRAMIEWADEVHVFWNQRTLGTIFDLGMAFALRKPIKAIYLEEKTLGNFVRQYERKGA